MTTLTVPRLRPNSTFVDKDGSLTLEGYRYLDGIYIRVGGSLDSLNAVTLADKTWDAPNPIGSTTPDTGKFTTLQSTGAFGCNGKPVRTSAPASGTIVTTAATNTSPYGFTTAAQADAIITKLNLIINALVANGIMS